MAYKWVWLPIVALVAGVAFYVDRTGSTEIVQGANDRRDYQYLELNNQLKVVLISDPAADMAAASLDVAVGSGKDPETREGLAHFLEHMLFLGTEKYPDAASYQAFISAHSGSHNAYTAFENTNYFFTIDPQYLNEALDRFSQFFIAPLFTEAYVDREKHAVHSEFMAKIKDDQRKSLEVFRDLVNPAHPFSQFSVGNLNTLSDRDGLPIREELMQFYQRYYSSNIMTLAVVGPQSLDQLKAMVVERFSQVPNRHVVEEPISLPLFVDGRLPELVYIKPEKRLRSLNLTFPVADNSEFYRQKPLAFISNILGHEGRGSLLSALKDRGWAEGLSAGPGLMYHGGGSFSVTVQLTELGLQHTDQIIAGVFKTVQLIAEEKSQWQRLFDEQSTLAQQQFNFQETGNAASYAMTVATNLQQYPYEDVLQGPYLMSDFDSRLIESYLSQLVPENCLVIITAPELETDRQTKRYQTDYRVQVPTDQQRARWISEQSTLPVAMPEKNEFIARNMTVLNASTSAVPKKLVDKSGLRLWYRGDDHFALPKGAVYLNLKSPVAANSVEHAAMLRLYAHLLNDDLNELSYPATLAGLHYSVSAHGRGLSVKVNGFTDKQTLLLDKILTAVNEAEFSPERFNDIRARLIRSADNAAKQQPYKLLLDTLGDLLYFTEWPQQQLAKAYREIELDDVMAYKTMFVDQLQVDALVYGNYQQSDALDVAATLRAHLPEIGHVGLPGVDILKVPSVSSVYRQHSVYSDSALLLYIQAADTDLTTRAAMALTAQMLESDFYSVLRTEKQLGYVVTSGVYPAIKVPGLFFLVQSPVMASGGLQQEVMDYLQQFAASTETVDGAAFNRYRQSLIQRLSEQPKSLWQQADQYWQDISLDFSQFDFKEQLIARLNEMTQAQWQGFFEQQVDLNKAPALWLYTQGQIDGAVPQAGLSIEDIPSFRQQQRRYHFD